MEEEIVDNINKNHESEKPVPSIKKLQALKGARQAKQIKKEYIETFNTTYLDQLDNIHTNLQALNKQINTITAYIGNKEAEVPKKRKIVIEESDEEIENPKKKRIIVDEKGDANIEKTDTIIEKDTSLIGYLPSFRLGQSVAIGISAVALYYLKTLTMESVKKDHSRYEKCDF